MRKQLQSFTSNVLRLCLCATLIIAPTTQAQELRWGHIGIGTDSETTSEFSVSVSTNVLTFANATNFYSGVSWGNRWGSY